MTTELFALPPQAVHLEGRAPASVVNVGPTTRWATPFEAGYTPHLRIVRGQGWMLRDHHHGICPDRGTALRWYREALVADAVRVDEVRRELRGRALGCTCRLPLRGQPDLCHRRVLIEVANA